MIEKPKNRNKKCVITEEDTASILQRYSANTILTLLQEVAQCSISDGAKINWRSLVAKTSTGINNVREYRMLWRHLAYRNPLHQNNNDPLEDEDDDSDLETELEVFPHVTAEASAEVAACVNILIASSSSDNASTVEAPLTINVPCSDNSQMNMDITVPVSVPKQPVSLPSVDGGFDGNDGFVNANVVPQKRKRKTWSESEDLELIAAVQKHGVGNWAHILRSEFKWDRTAAQLAHRWNSIRKKNIIANFNPVGVGVGVGVGTTTTTTGGGGGVQLSKVQLAARHAMNLALDPPVRNSISVNKHQNPRPFTAVAKSQSDFNKSQHPAGARIPAQPKKNAVHFMPTGGSSIKSSLPGGTSNHPDDYHSRNVNIADQAAAPPSSSTLQLVSAGRIRFAASPTTIQHTPSVSEATAMIKSMSAKQSIVEETTGRIKILPEDVAEKQVNEEAKPADAERSIAYSKFGKQVEGSEINNQLATQANRCDNQSIDDKTKQ